MINQEETKKEETDRLRRQGAATAKPTYEQELAALRTDFEHAFTLPPQQRGYALERLFPALMRLSSIQVIEPFRIVGEQLDGAIKYDGHYYLVELKWIADQLEPAQVGSFYFKVEGKLGARGMVIAMNGYSSSVVESVSKGKELKVLLLDGNHLANVIYGHYRFSELLDHAIEHASLRGLLYCLLKLGARA